MSARRPFTLWSQGRWPVRQVVGESYRADDIRKLFPARKLVSYDDALDTVARLVPEPANPHDPNAVAVYVERVLVGYLAKEEAASYQPVLRQLNASGFEAEVPCRISGNEYVSEDLDRRGRVVKTKVFYPVVTLVLDEWYRCVPVNPPPRDHVLLPSGQALQLQKEEDHQDVLRRYLNANGECWAYGTLHEIAGGTAKAPKPIVEVRIDGSRVGQLTPAMSAHFIPTISALESAGRATAAQVVVKGNPIKVEVVLYAQKAHDLDPGWVAQHMVRHSTEPLGQTFNPAPGWPTPPAGWTPPPGWQPNPEWPAAPPGWRFWI